MLFSFIIAGIPNFKDDTSDETLDEVISASRLFQLSHLETICVNIKNDEEFLNPSIGTFLNDETGQKMKDLFLNKPLLADVTFTVEGRIVNSIIDTE